MKTLVTVPSFNRPYDIEKRTGFWLKQLEKFDFRVFVEPNQYLYYKQVFPKENLVITKNNNGIYGQLIDMAEYAMENGYDLITKIDDDTYYTDEKYKKQGAAKVFDRSMTEIEERFKNNGSLGVVGFTSGMDYVYNKGKGFKKRNKPVYGTCVVRPIVLQQLRRDYKVFADLFIAVECKLMSLEIESYYNCHENRLTEKNKGGLQSFNRKKLASETVKMALKDYPKSKLIAVGEGKYQFQDLDVSEYFK